MELRQILSGVELFDGLSDEELDELGAIFADRVLRPGELLAQQGSPGEELFLVIEGFVEVAIENGEEQQAQIVVNLGSGQIIGEMSLVDRGPRSATVRALSNPTIVKVATRRDFEKLCQTNTRIGYFVMRNIAADLSFKLRHRNLTV